MQEKKPIVKIINEKRVFIVNEEENLVLHIEQYASKKGYTFPTLLIKNFYFSLKTKPFVILCGISGTGKTKLAQLFAEAVYGEEKAEYFKLVPVQPDWTAPRFMLGFYNPLTERYEKTPFLEILLEADKNPDYAYFVCLDEMNLARVEYYFSTFLSALESDEEITLHNSEKCDVPQKIKAPINLFFIGTVNIDETTHQFSPKVLDRANTIEFNEVDLLEIFNRKEDKSDKEIKHLDKNDFNLIFLQTKEETTKWEKWLNSSGKEIVEKRLVRLNEILRKSYLHFGYRVRDEILEYMFWANEISMTEQEAFDIQVMQKILPKIKGGPGIDKEEKETLSELQKFLTDNKLKISADRVGQMKEQLKAEGYTSFWR